MVEEKKHEINGLIKAVSEDDENEFKKWASGYSIYDMTCRPVSNEGKRIAEVQKPCRLSYFIDGVEKPVGRFTWFDYNPRNESAEFGYIVSPKFQNRGICTKMLKDAFNHIFSNTKVNKLYCQTAVFNKASVKVLRKIGMHLDGILRQHHEKNGTLHDDLLFSILRSEWEKSS